MKQIQTKRCEACGTLMLFVRSPDGKSMPVQRVRNSYRLGVADDGEAQAYAQDAGQGALAGHFISHFETCPEASNFSKGKK